MRIALVGYGKMGKHIEQLATAQGHVITHRLGSVDADRLDQLRDTDVAIEFTAPHAALSNFEKLFKSGIPVVTGTTGWYGQYETAVAMANAHRAKFMYATNFSVGVHLALAANAYLARLMQAHERYICEIDEWHHTAKKDAPSGTAITFAERVIENNMRYEKWQLVNGVNTSTDHDNTIAIRAFRTDDTPGTHRVSYNSQIDQISLEHKAHNRDGFAGGAIAAASWLTAQEPGIYTMKDFLKL